MTGKPPVRGKWWKIGLPAVAALALLHLSGTRTPAQTGPLYVEASPITTFNNFTSTIGFGAFTWRGGLTLTSPSDGFGGLSGLVLSNNCEDLLAISDQGRWFTATLTYDGATLTGLNAHSLLPIRDRAGKIQKNEVWTDAEAVTRLQSGQIAVAFERRVRIGTYDLAAKGLSAPFVPIPYPHAIDEGPWNGEIESLGQLPSGDLIAIAERQRNADGNSLAWIWNGTRTTAFAIERYSTYNVTDLAVLPDGSVLTMERSLTKTSLPGMAIRRFDPKSVKSGTLVKPELLLEASVPIYAIDNMEGIALCERDGETRVTLLSDNNFNTYIQSTVLLQFAYRP